MENIFSSLQISIDGYTGVAATDGNELARRVAAQRGFNVYDAKLRKVFIDSGQSSLKIALSLLTQGDWDELQRTFVT